MNEDPGPCTKHGNIVPLKRGSNRQEQGTPKKKGAKPNGPGKKVRNRSLRDAFFHISEQERIWYYSLLSIICLVLLIEWGNGSPLGYVVAVVVARGALTLATYDAATKRWMLMKKWTQGATNSVLRSFKNKDLRSVPGQSLIVLGKLLRTAIQEDKRTGPKMASPEMESPLDRLIGLCLDWFKKRP